jgi:carbon monoxide dehydrogenase subunit G
MATLLERTFDVPVGVADAWTALADIHRWPEWAPHIAGVRLTPDGPVTPTTSGAFRFRPIGRARFRMTEFVPPRSWTWTGRVMGVVVHYDHAFAELASNQTRLTWTVRCERPGLRARVFASVYGRLIDRAWPRFVASLT